MLLTLTLASSLASNSLRSFCRFTSNTLSDYVLGVLTRPSPTDVMLMPVSTHVTLDLFERGRLPACTP